MPISRTYGCPSCEGSFKFLHMTRDEPPPAHCELCGEFMSEPEEQLAAPAVRTDTALGKSVEQVYQAVAEKSGVQNMNDGLQAGEVAAVARRPVNNAVTQVAEQVGHQYWQSNTSSYIADAKKAPRSDTNVALAGIQRHRIGRL